MTRSIVPVVILPAVEARARGLVPTREAADLYGCWRESIAYAMRSAGYTPTKVRCEGGQVTHWWFPAEVLAARTRHRNAKRGRPRRPRTKATQRKLNEFFRVKVLRRVAQREAAPRTQHPSQLST
jgi:hypothetical protein